jgi:hypothetical protein
MDYEQQEKNMEIYWLEYILYIVFKTIYYKIFFGSEYQLWLQSIYKTVINLFLNLPSQLFLYILVVIMF